LQYPLSGKDKKDKKGKKGKKGKKDKKDKKNKKDKTKQAGVNNAEPEQPEGEIVKRKKKYNKSGDQDFLVYSSGETPQICGKC
jgi:hypothetical protein